MASVIRKVVVGNDAVTQSAFGQMFESGLRIVISAISGGVTSLGALDLGAPKVIVLGIGTLVAGVVLAFLKYIDQGPTTS